MSAALATADVDDAVTSAAANLTALSRLQPETDWLRADPRGVTQPPRVDRLNGVIYGRVLAEKGPFKSKGRGEFDDASLDRIVELANQHPAGLKARFTHPALSSDGLGKFLGRDRNVRRDGDRVLGDLHLDKTALGTPPSGGKPLGAYVMDLAASDPAAFGSSLVLKADKEQRLAADGTAAKDDQGDTLPPLWRPTKLHACDVVDDGDAVHNGFLSADLPDAVVRDVAAALDSQFSGCDRPTVEARGRQFLTRYLDLRFGDDDMSTDAAADPKPQPKPQPQPQPQPTNPPGNPPAPTNPDQPPANPNQPPSLAAERAALEQLAADIRREAEVARDEQRKALAAAKQARVADFIDSRSKAGKIAPWELDEADPAKAHLSLRQRLLSLSAEPTVRVGDQLQSPLDVELAAIDVRPVRPHGPRLLDKPGEGDQLTADRRRQLLSYTPVGRAILKDEAQVAAR